MRMMVSLFRVLSSFSFSHRCVRRWRLNSLDPVPHSGTVDVSCSSAPIVRKKAAPKVKTKIPETSESEADAMATDDDQSEEDVKPARTFYDASFVESVFKSLVV